MNENVTVTLSQPALIATSASANTGFSTNERVVVYLCSYYSIDVVQISQNLFALFLTIKRNPCITYSNAKLVLLQEKAEPHTFLQFVFVNKTELENGAIEQEVLCHELAHVQQKHSIDILFIELLSIFIWFNPVIYFYKKAIQLNHEFLADDAVNNKFNDTRAYQFLLLSKMSSTNTVLLTNHFSYSITKKRLIMLTKNTSLIAAVCRQAAAIIVFAAVAVVFSEKVFAQKKPVPQQQDSTTTITQMPTQKAKKDTSANPFIFEVIGSTKEGVSQAMLDEYAAIIDKYKTKDENWMRDLGQNIIAADKERLINIFKQMSKEQQSKQNVGFLLAGKPLPKSTPTPKQFESFKNSKVYGVWIDDKKVSNSVLQNYRNTDFAQVGVSKLYANARRNVNYYYQVNLSTKAHYQHYYEEAMARRQEPIMVTVQKFVGKKKNETILRSM